MAIFEFDEVSFSFAYAIEYNYSNENSDEYSEYKQLMWYNKAYLN